MRRLLTILYDLLWIAILVFLIPYLAARILLYPSWRTALRERLSIYPPGLRAKLEGRSPIWIHCVSVGEVTAAGPLLERLAERGLGGSVVLSTQTRAGYLLARERYEGIAGVFMLPLDFSPFVERTFRLFRPRALLLFETELWMNLIRKAGEQGVPVFLLSGRISERNLRRVRYFRWFYRSVLSGLTAIAAQTEEDARRFRFLGAREEQVSVAGNLKFDLSAGGGAAPNPALLEALEGREVFVAGSTHGGEEEAAVAVLRRLRQGHPKAVLLLAPRHLDRLGSIEAGLQRDRVSYVRRTKISGRLKEEAEVLLLDTIGELASLYALARVVFVGGSLVPVGGHNLLEPAAQGKPVLFGPHTSNFRVEAELLLSAGAARRVRGCEELAEGAWLWFEDPRAAAEAGGRGREAIRRHRGATERCLCLIEGVLSGPGGRGSEAVG